ncbi:hypothetical protein PHYC_03029 [Phycisphaerales bacterium]|nr:hypothetical protein PHYC_03029 [Phycisphaerales bacterium]
MNLSSLTAVCVFAASSAALGQTPCPQGYQVDSGFIGAGEPTMFGTPTTHVGVAFDFDGPGPNAEWFVVGGLFGSMDGLPTRNIAAWDGREWHAIGIGLGGTSNSDGVAALCVHNGELYAAGRFSVNNDTQAIPQVARWDGASWQSVGPMFSGPVTSLASFSGNLYAGGQFNTNLLPNFARWTGTSWQGYQWANTGPGASNSRVETMTQHDGALMIAGTFPMRVARFDGTNPATPLGTTINCPFSCSGGVYGLLSDGGNLYAAGDYRLWPTNTQPGVMRWDGATWTAMQATSNPMPRTIFSHNGQLLLCTGGTTGSSELRTWNGTQWVNFGPSQGWFSANITTFEFLGQFEGRAILGGLFGGIRPGAGAPNGRWMKCIAAYDGADFYPITRGPDARVTKMLDWNGETLAVGRFITVGSATASRIAIRDEQGFWRPFEGNEGFNNDAWAAAIFEGQLIVGGSFTQAGGVPVNHVARWTGQAWEPMGTGLDSFPSFMEAVDGTLWAATTATAGRMEFFDGIFRWMNGAWEPVPMPVQISRLTSLGTELYASAFDGSVSYVYRWNGAEFAPLGTHSDALRMSVFGRFNGFLIGQNSTGLYRWTGSDWEFVHGPGAGLAGAVGREDVEADGLMFVSANTSNSEQVFSWDGQSWGTQGTMHLNPGTTWGLISVSLRPPSLFARGNDVLVGGAFMYLDGNRSRPGSYFAHTLTDWRPRTVSAPALFTARDAGQSVELAWNTTGDVTFRRWYKDGTALNDGPVPGLGVVSGAQTGTLTITDLEPGASGRYHATAGNACGLVTLAHRTLHVPQPCDGDLNQDGALNNLDMEYLEAILNGADNPTGRDPDFNRDGAENGFDIESLSAVINGEPCP